MQHEIGPPDLPSCFIKVKVTGAPPLLGMCWRVTALEQSGLQMQQNMRTHAEGICCVVIGTSAPAPAW